MGFLDKLFKPSLARMPEDLNEAAERLSVKAAAGFLMSIPEIKEAFTQADIELALDDRGWLVGGKRMAGELDPMSRTVQVNRSRYYWLRDPLAKQAVRLWTDYSLGADAMSYQCDDTGVTAKLDKFTKDRRNRQYMSSAGMRKLSTRLLVDGELFFLFFDDGTIRTVDCLQMTDITTDPDDEDLVLAYKRVTAGAYGQAPKTLYYRPWDLPEDANEPQDPVTHKAVQYEDGVVCYHLPFDPLEKRGNPLLSSCSDWSREHRRFMTARVALTQALSKFAYRGSVKGGQRLVDTIRGKMESTFSQTGLSGGTEHQPPNAPGGVFLSNDGFSLEAMPRTTGANDAKSDADGLKLMVSAGTGIMLHYFGDPSTGNLATATAMELPMRKMFEAYQSLWRGSYRDMFSIVLEEQPEDTQADITIQLPDILEADLASLGTFLSALTTVFPEAKQPAVLKQCLVSMNIENVDDVLKAAADKRKEIDDNVANGLNPDGSDPKPVAVMPGKNPDPKDGGSAGTNQDATEAEAERFECLIQEIGRLADFMEFSDEQARDDQGRWTDEGDGFTSRRLSKSADPLLNTKDGHEIRYKGHQVAVNYKALTPYVPDGSKVSTGYTRVNYFKVNQAGIKAATGADVPPNMKRYSGFKQKKDFVSHVKEHLKGK